MKVVVVQGFANDGHAEHGGAECELFDDGDFFVLVFYDRRDLLEFARASQVLVNEFLKSCIFKRLRFY